MKFKDMVAPEEIKKKVTERVVAISENMSLVADCSVVDMFAIPVILVMNYSDNGLSEFYKRLMRTRRKEMTFFLNANASTLTREQAISVAKQEILARGLSKSRESFVVRA